MRRSIVVSVLTSALAVSSVPAFAGTLWTVGQNLQGQLGDGTTTRRSVPVQLPFNDVTAMAAGERHSVFLRSDGSMWVMGWNFHGQLGDGTNNDALTPVQRATDVAKIGAGYFHTVYVKTDGTLWAVGGNAFGQLGDGSGDNRATPLQVTTGVVAADGGGNHTLFLKTDGTLWGMGSNGVGQLGDGTTENRHVPVQLATDVQSFAAGSWHSLYVKTDGTLWATGLNDRGQLGDGTTTSRTEWAQVPDMTGVVAVAAGDYHTLILKSDGTLWTMGENGAGQLGDDTVLDRSTPVQVATDVAQIAAGGWTSYYIKTDGTLWSMGNNAYGQLGDDTTLSSVSAIAVAGAADFVAVGENHALWSIASAAFGIQTQPQSQTISAGEPSAMFVLPAGVPAVSATYQWQLDGADIPDATRSFYLLPSTQEFDEGSYTVRVSFGGASLTSNPAVITVNTPASSGARLLNASTRAQVLAEPALMIPGFVLQGSGNKKMLMRVAGPILQNIGVTVPLGNPRMLLKRLEGSSYVDLANNDDWGSNSNVADINATTTAVGTFGFFSGSVDSVLLSDLAPNQYQIHVTGTNDTTGIALAELYDADENPTSRIVNLSTRGHVGTGENVMILGFVISGEGPLTVLLRGVGPTLGQPPSSVPDTIADPRLTVFAGLTPLFSNDDWENNPDAARTAQVATQVGAFALGAGSKDAALVVTLLPGAYTMHINDVTQTGGIALAEIYVVE